MKKSFLTLILLFIISSVNFANGLTAVKHTALNNCADYAYRMAAREAQNYGGFDNWGEWYESFTFYYDACFETGDNIQDVVFL